ncbi:hypothetical protein EUGRSUZ_B03678 [Eucalyptus grandis]|uniref:Uncharacterized protein n=2 Tax=Eucalyptus grandis TaxID=71139 RepID=A0ACC3LXD3_EUCGR|nr:hypothetical protein EUGRSUZ_B03678 [Eucalyptus grandis]
MVGSFASSRSIRSVRAVRFPMNSGFFANAVVLVVAEDVEIAAGAVGDGPGEELVGLEGGEEAGEEGVVGGPGEAAEDGDLPPGAAGGVVGGGLVDELEGEGGGGGGVGGGVVDEEDGAHCSLAQDLEGPEVVEVELRRGRRRH